MRFAKMAAAAILLAALAGQVSAKPTDAQVEEAIQKGINFLWSLEQPNGDFSPDGKFWWTQTGFYANGCEAIATCALAVAGVPLKDERMKRAFERLLDIETEYTYIRACRVIAISRILNRRDMEPDPRAKKILEADVKWLMKIQLDEKYHTGKAGGMWNYGSVSNPMGSTNPDFSNTQFALLALQEFEMAGGELPNTPFERALKIYLERQKPDGGWNYGWLNATYQDGTPALFDTDAYGSMTAAGCASMFVIRDKLFSSMGCPCKGGRSSRGPEKVDTSIDRALDWLAQNYRADVSPKEGHFYYWHYSCERVGLASGLKYFGSHDWYSEGADWMINHQGKDGSWSGARSIQDTCYNIMFLVKGRAPILLNKLQFAGAWGLHPRDAANLAKYVGRAKEQTMNWQVINLDAPVEEWHDAPILYVSAETPIKLTDEHKKKLRRYTDTGGTILVEASCTNQAVATSWRKTCAEVWPEWELKKIEKDHPLWIADLNLKGQLPLLWGCSDGVRTFLIFTQQDLSCPWHTEAVTTNKLLFDMGCNLYAYTTDRGKLRTKLSGGRLDDRPEFQAAAVAGGQRSTLRTRLLKHGGDWYITRQYRPLEVLAAYLQGKAKVTLQVGDPITAGDPALKETDLLWVTGRKTFSLSPDETTALKNWLAGGGYLVAEACMGDEKFDADFAAVAKELGLEMKSVSREEAPVLGGITGSSGFKLAPLDFTVGLRTDRVGKFHAEFQTLHLGGKLVGVYTPFDVSLAVAGIKAFGNRGYAIMDGRAVATNMILPATTMAVAPPPAAPGAGSDATPGAAPAADPAKSFTAPGGSEAPKTDAAPDLPPEYRVVPNEPAASDAPAP